MDKGGAGSFDRVMGGWEALRQNRAPSEIVRWCAMEDARLARAMVEASRDDPCPCGSGRPVKRCHGRWGK
jgi:uncharacterized protein YecA (UPF0149 family)